MRGIARILRSSRNAKGSCARCLHWRHLHATPFAGETISALCERCFAETTPDQRLRFYRKVWVVSRTRPDPETAKPLSPIQDDGTTLARYRTTTLLREWNAIHAAVMAGD